MNARTQVFELSVEGRQIEEVVEIYYPRRSQSLLNGEGLYTISIDHHGSNSKLRIESIFHTLLLHRTIGKFHFKQESSYSIGTVGIVDVDCDFIDFTYVRTASDELDRKLKGHVSLFRDTLRSQDGPGSGQISLEFYQKKKTRWLFSPECIPWEVWTIKLDILTLSNESERQLLREKLGEVLAEKLMNVAEAMNRHEYVPKMPNQSELDLVFDTTIADVQPYLYRISHQTTTPPPSVSNTMRKFLKDTLAF